MKHIFSLVVLALSSALYAAPICQGDEGLLWDSDQVLSRMVCTSQSGPALCVTKAFDSRNSSNYYSVIGYESHSIYAHVEAPSHGGRAEAVVRESNSTLSILDTPTPNLFGHKKYRYLFELNKATSTALFRVQSKSNPPYGFSIIWKTESETSYRCKKL